MPKRREFSIFRDITTFLEKGAAEKRAKAPRSLAVCGEAPRGYVRAYLSGGEEAEREALKLREAERAAAVFRARRPGPGAEVDKQPAVLRLGEDDGVVLSQAEEQLCPAGRRERPLLQLIQACEKAGAAVA